MASREKEREEQRMKLGREEIVERISQALPKDGWKETVPGFFLTRSSKPLDSLNTVHQPAFCFIAQGSKRALLAEKVYRYDPGHYLIFTVDLPLIFQIEEGSEKRPCLGVRLNLDPSVVASVMLESGISANKGDAGAQAMDVSSVGADLLDAVVKLVRVGEDPTESKVLAPLLIREIVFRLVAGGQTARLGHLVSTGDTQRISKAIGHLRRHFDEPLKIEDVAREFGMSVSGFHHHFKSVTAMSPLQYQKQIRLQEAPHLMLGEDFDAASAGMQVGYENPSYFSRDYKKQFGAPPQRDIANLRQRIDSAIK